MRNTDLSTKRHIEMLQYSSLLLCLFSSNS